MSKKSNVAIYPEEGFVIKTPLKWVDIVFEREVAWLKKFSELNSKRFPHLVSANYKTDTIKMTYCGEPINKKNCPKDWRVQIEDILAELNFFNCI